MDETLDIITANLAQPLMAIAANLALAADIRAECSPEAVTRFDAALGEVIVAFDSAKSAAEEVRATLAGGA